MAGPAMTLPLFDTPDPGPQTLSHGAVVLRGWARAQVVQGVAQVAAVTAQAPFRTMVRPGGAPLSVAMTNCGAWGWVSDARRDSCWNLTFRMERVRYAAPDRP